MLAAHLNTISLQAIDGDGAVIGLGSGCLVRTSSGRVLVGVRHVVNNAKRWCMHISIVPGRGSELFSLPVPTYFERFTANGARLHDLDFFAVVVPSDLSPVYQEVKGLHAIGDAIPKRIFDLSEIAPPDGHQRYGFFGAVMPMNAGAFLEVHPQTETDLQFVAEDAGQITFRLAGKHKGHVAYEGCSGAPITDQTGLLVSLVIGGDEASDVIFGVPLHRYRSAVVVTAMEALAGR